MGSRTKGLDESTGAGRKAFELVAGWPVLDLVNTLDDRFDVSGPVELIAGYGDLLRFVLQAGLITERQARKLKRLEATAEQQAGVVKQVRALRESLASVLYGLVDGEAIAGDGLRELEGMLKEAAGHRRLTLEAGRLKWDWRGIGREVASPLWLLAQSANELVEMAGSGGGFLLRECASPTCRWLFLDTSKNHSRRWCDMKICGNRSKVRRFLERQAEA